MTAVSKIPLRQVQDVKSLLHNDQARGQLAAVAAKHMSPERLMRVTANAIRTTPKLQEAEPLSFLGALMQCASLGLEPNTVMGHAYLIPFWNGRKGVNEVQLVVGYKGLIDLARRSGHITSISANIHYEDDELWEYEEGTEARLRHRPGPQDGEKLHAYAIAQFRDGGHAYVVLPWAKVIKIRDASQNWQNAAKYGKQGNTPWAQHEDAMAMKTAIRALAKYLPLSIEFRDAVQIDNDGGAQVDFASYAMNPQDGITIDGDVVEGDEDSGPEQDQQADALDGRSGADRKPQEQEKSPAAEEPQTTSANEEALKRHNMVKMVKSHIEDDLADGAPVADTKAFHADSLAAMKTEAPDLHAEVMAIFEDYEKASS